MLTVKRDGTIICKDVITHDSNSIILKKDGTIVCKGITEGHIGIKFNRNGYIYCKGVIKNGN